MTARIAQLEDRGVLAVTGEDADGFLQGLVTNDLDRLKSQAAIHTALLTPQGKILFEFFLARNDQGLVIDVARETTAALAKRLGFYKLRAKVTIKDLSDQMTVLAVWGGAPDPTEHAILYTDPRAPGLGWRVLADSAGLAGIPEAMGCLPATAADYHAHRIGLGVPEGGKDYAFTDTFPHEADLDQLGSIDFRKGCYVGQEIVSRIEHRGTARKRIVPVTGAVALPPCGAEIRAGEATIGTLGSVAGMRGLAMLRLDRAAEAAGKGEPLLAGAVPVTIDKPDWARFEIAPKGRTATS